MSCNNRLLRAAAFAAALGVLVAWPAVAAAAEGRVSYQGSLVLADGSAAPDGAYDLVVSLWDAPSGGTWHWTQFHGGVAVRDGVFSVVLGSADATGPLEDALDAGGRYLETVVASGGGLVNANLGRVRLTSVPYAIRALRAEQADRLVGATHTDADASLPPGAIVLFADGVGCPAGFEPMDGSAASAGAAVDLRARFPLGADPEGLHVHAPDRVAQRGGAVHHAHSGVTSGEIGSNELALPGGKTASIRNHKHVVTGGATSHLPPYFTVLFCRKQ